MSKTKIAAIAAVMVAAIPVFAQDTTTTQTTTTTTTVQTAPSTQTQDQTKLQQEAADKLGNPDVHWTEKDRVALLVNAPYVRPRDLWEITHLLHMLPSNEERVIFAGVTNALHSNAGDYYERQAAMDQYWLNRVGNPNNVQPPMTTATPYGDTTNMRGQGMVGGAMAVGTGMSAIEAWELMQHDLNAPDRTTFRYTWNRMTSSQQEALINVVRQSGFYYEARRAGRYFYVPY